MDGTPAGRRTAARLLLGGPGGAVRGAGVLCVLVALVARGPVDAALFALVLAGLVVPVVGGVGGGLDAAYGAGLLAAAWSGALGWYEAVSWLDLVMHLVVTGLVAAVAHRVVARRTGAVVDPGVAGGPRALDVGSVAVTAALGLALSVMWEVGEYLGDTYVDPSIHVAYRDTIGDLVMGGLGSTAAGVGLVLAGRARAAAASRSTHPGRADTHPGGADTRPGGADTHAGGTDPHPGGADTHPGGTDTRQPWAEPHGGGGVDAHGGGRVDAGPAHAGARRGDPTA